VTVTSKSTLFGVAALGAAAARAGAFMFADAASSTQTPARCELVSLCGI
jgi:hypothetical protein